MINMAPRPAAPKRALGLRRTRGAGGAGGWWWEGVGRGGGERHSGCLDKQITSKLPAARVKKILRSGSGQMNPPGGDQRPLMTILINILSLGHRLEWRGEGSGILMTFANCFVLRMLAS